ncbi:MAG: NUDIX hydrolase [Pseudomonadota bacterium]
MKRPYKTARCILYRDDHYLLAVHNRYWGGRQRWGLPGGQVERGESPRAAAARELNEELRLRDPKLEEVGAYRYKGALHMVYAAPLAGDVHDFDTVELLDIGWFTEPAVARLGAEARLHARYEIDAIRRLRAQLECGAPRAAASF